MGMGGCREPTSVGEMWYSGRNTDGAEGENKDGLWRSAVGCVTVGTMLVLEELRRWYQGPLYVLIQVSGTNRVRKLE